jgi:hypothetical protein
MTQTEIKIIRELVDREIDVFISVWERTGRDYWMGKVGEYRKIIEKLDRMSLDAQFSLESETNSSCLGNTSTGPSDIPKIVDINDVPTQFGDIEGHNNFFGER